MIRSGLLIGIGKPIVDTLLLGCWLIFGDPDLNRVGHADVRYDLQVLIGGSIVRGDGKYLNGIACAQPMLHRTETILGYLVAFRAGLVAPQNRLIDHFVSARDLQFDLLQSEIRIHRMDLDGLLQVDPHRLG